jgi:hypothetical protein
MTKTLLVTAIVVVVGGLDFLAGGYHRSQGKPS